MLIGLSLNSLSKLKISSDISSRLETSDGLVIQQNDKIHTLNLTATEILDLFDGNRSIDTIVDEIDNRYHGHNVRPVIKDFIEQLYDAGLVHE